MTDKAKQIRAAYMKEWRAKNPDKERKYKERYWEKKAKSQRSEVNNNDDSF